MSASSEVDICNMALGFLGASRIISLDDSDECKANYPICRDACLEDVDWTFAATRLLLQAPSADPPAFGFTYQFLLPGDILRVIEVNDNEDEWAREGNYILTNASSCRIKAVKKVIDVRLFSSAFIQAVAARLAAVIAIPITNSDGMARKMFALYESFKAESAQNDGRQGSNQRIVRRDIRLRHQL